MIEKLQVSPWLKLSLLLLLMTTGLDVRAAPASCEVVAVADGDTITVLCGYGPEQDIRLAGVDRLAPQSLFRARATRSLSDLVLQKQVTVDVVDTDTDGEAIAQVYLGSVHVNASVVANGMARCHGPASGWCEREEASARSGLRGLWSDPWLTTRSVERSVAGKRGQAT